MSATNGTHGPGDRKHLVELEVSNFKRVKNAHLVMGGQGLLILGGNNAAGKSSVLDALEALLAGGRHTPPRPIRDGATEAQVVGRLSDGTVITRRFKRSKDGGFSADLLILGPEGKVNKPQDWLDRLYSLQALDPVAFESMKARDQVEALKAAVLTAEQRKELGTLEFEREQLFRQRTGVNADAKSAADRAARAVKHPDAPQAEIGSEAIAAELKAAEEERRAYEELKRRAAQCTDRVRSAESRCKQIEKELAEANEERASAVAAAGAIAARLDATAAPADPSAIQKRLAEVNETNRKVRDNKEAAKLAAESETLAAKAAELTDKLTEIDKRKSAMVAEALTSGPMAALSLGLTPDFVTLNGRPFEQASHAERLRVSTAVALASNPQVPLAIVREGSRLDKNGREAIGKAARDAGALILLEVVGNDGVDIEMVDGVSKATATPTAGTAA